MSARDDALTALRAALPELRRRWPIRSLTVFGSVAREEADPASDLDILVEFHEPIGLSAFLALEDALTGLTRRPVDLVSRGAEAPHRPPNPARSYPAVNTPRDYRDFLADILSACRSIIQFVEGMDLDGYLADEKTRYAVMRGYEIMGEAVRHVPDNVKAAAPDIPSTTMAAVRNRITHAYFGIDDTILFTTVDADLKPLLPRLEALVREHTRPSPEPA